MGSLDGLADESALERAVTLVAIEMGYGHLRPAVSLAKLLFDTEVLLADGAALASEQEQEKWRRARSGYEMLSRAGRLPFVGRPLKEILDAITRIPSLYPRRDLSAPDLGVRILEKMAEGGLGRGLADHLRRTESTLLTTFYGPAVLSDHHGAERVYCVVTDADVHRIWAPIKPSQSQVHYFAPTSRVKRRLKVYGVPSENITVTGYPLPHELLGGPDAETLRENLRRRLVTLDPRRKFLRDGREEVAHFLGELPDVAPKPLHLVFAVGGAGAQAEMADRFLPSLARRIRRDKLHVTLVAGVRSEVAARFMESIEKAGLADELARGSLAILLATSHDDYFRRFNELLARADVLWTKPSELCFFGALGIPILFAEPLGSHERYNRRWAIDTGSGLKEWDPSHTGEWLWELLKDGTLAGAAWSGYMRMPKFGLYRIAEEVLGPVGYERSLARLGVTRRAPSVAPTL